MQRLKRRAFPLGLVWSVGSGKSAFSSTHPVLIPPFSSSSLLSPSWKILSLYILILIRYEWSLGLGEPCFGIDIKTKKATFFDDGNTKINTTTWEQCGTALAGLLSLKELPEDENDKSATVSSWKNKPFYISSFLVSQREMLDSVHRVMGTTDADWEITFEKSDERYAKGLADLKQGQRLGFARAMYSRNFYPNGDGDYESRRGLDNEKIGLQKGDLDTATKKTIELVGTGWNPFGGVN
jgi:hypothetical protein